LFLPGLFTQPGFLLQQNYNTKRQQTKPNAKTTTENAATLNYTQPNTTKNNCRRTLHTREVAGSIPAVPTVDYQRLIA